MKRSDTGAGGGAETARTEAGAIVRRYCDAWQSGDVAALLDAYHDDVVLEWPGRHHLAGTHRGKAAALHALGSLQAATNRTLMQVRDVLVGESSVIATVTELWTREPTDGDPVSGSLHLDRALEYTVADGRILTCRIYETNQPAVDEWLDAHVAT